MRLNCCFEKLMDNQIDILILFADQIDVLSSILTSNLFTKTESLDRQFGHHDWLGRQLGKKTRNFAANRIWVCFVRIPAPVSSTDHTRKKRKRPMSQCRLYLFENSTFSKMLGVKMFSLQICPHFGFCTHPHRLEDTWSCYVSLDITICLGSFFHIRFSFPRNIFSVEIEVERIIIALLMVWLTCNIRIEMLSSLSLFKVKPGNW